MKKSPPFEILEELEYWKICQSTTFSTKPPTAVGVADCLASVWLLLATLFLGLQDPCCRLS